MKIVKEFSNGDRVLRCMTHAGRFHSDEIFGAVLLSKIAWIRNMKMELIRTLDLSNIQDDVIVFDTGRGKFDHHQPGGNGTHINGVPYSSFGLLWNEFGMEYLNSDNLMFDLELPSFFNQDSMDLMTRVFERFGEYFVSCIDAGDNGYNEKISHIFPIQNLFAALNPAWFCSPQYGDMNKFSEALVDENLAFERAVNDLAQILFDVILRSVISEVLAESVINMGIAEFETRSSADRYIILPYDMPWQEMVVKYNQTATRKINYVIYPSRRGGFSIKGVPVEIGSFKVECPFPERWRGKVDGDLQQETGLKDVTFCHNTGFTAAAKTLDVAIMLANLSTHMVQIAF